MYGVLRADIARSAGRRARRFFATRRAAAALHDGLLAYSRVETRGDPFEPVDLNAVLEDVLVEFVQQQGGEYFRAAVSSTEDDWEIIYRQDRPNTSGLDPEAVH